MAMKTTSLRFPEEQLEEMHVIANYYQIPYQVLLREWITEGLQFKSTLMKFELGLITLTKQQDENIKRQEFLRKLQSSQIPFERLAYFWSCSPQDLDGTALRVNNSLPDFPASIAVVLKETESELLILPFEETSRNGQSSIDGRRVLVIVGGPYRPVPQCRMKDYTPYENMHVHGQSMITFDKINILPILGFEIIPTSWGELVAFRCQKT